MTPRPENQPHGVPTSTLPYGPRRMCEDSAPPERPPEQARPNTW